MDRSFAPIDPRERMKRTMTLLEMVQKGLAEGHLKMWGMNPGGNQGFAVTDADEKDIFAEYDRPISFANHGGNGRIHEDDSKLAWKGKGGRE